MRLQIHAPSQPQLGTRNARNPTCFQYGQRPSLGASFPQAPTMKSESNSVKPGLASLRDI